MSDDLIRWKDLPPAIVNGPEPETWTGSVYAEEDRVIAAYRAYGGGGEMGIGIAVSSDPLLVNWEKIPEKKKAEMARKLTRAAERLRLADLSKPARTRIGTKLKFHAVRMLQKKLGRDDPEYTDYKYWKENGWTGAVRPWKRG